MSEGAGVVPGPTNSLVDVAGIRVGHRTATDGTWLSGSTVVLAPPEGAVGGVDVRGGGPGTHETDLLDPRNVVERVNAIVLCGGSAFGLAAAHGVADRLAAAGSGVRVNEEIIVPIVPAASVFDLGRGGDATARPDVAFGAGAYDAALDAGAGAVPARGNVGAGTGAVAGVLKGGVGTASAVLGDGTTVAALAVVNSAGSPVDPATGELYGQRYGLPGDPAPERPSPGDLAAYRATVADTPGVSLNTTLGVVATDATLSKARCAKIAGIAHDGLARAIRPVHTMYDGDTVFCLATGERAEPDQFALHALLTAAGDCMTRAIVDGLLAADSVRTSGGAWFGFRDAFPSANARTPGGDR
ncbi:putative pantetheine hydrolase [Lipingzhangella halophila]|uniref:Putative pantetheine hydrolase n=1 Tax=Lipingzhangella halophila TaxID=1783352 RepID=A0A7W7RJW0_9ACTN|nr:P1 family peptidase [Lipingzhangella halophila]MBB4933348.1 putative pantetheine hydrolase [Lipingzhangella halophila]